MTPAYALILITLFKGSVSQLPISDYPSFDACQKAGTTLVASWEHSDRRLRPSFVCLEIEGDQ